MRRWSTFAYWLKENPDEPLPPSIKGIAEVSGVHYNAVKGYLYRLRKEAKRQINLQPWKGGRCVSWEDTLGNYIPDVSFDYVRSYVGLSGTIKFYIRLKDRTAHTFYMTPYELQAIYE